LSICIELLAFLLVVLRHLLFLPAL
jgi:hypothetical protein